MRAQAPWVDGFVKVRGEADECNSWAFEEGDSFTVVAFFSPVDALSLGHVVWHAYLHLDLDERA